jgi:hypothetical protein
MTQSNKVFSARRVITTIVIALGAGGALGCYVYEPTMSSLLVPGKSVALDLNDRGRLDLAPLIGAEVRRLSGVLVSQTSAEYVMHVNQLGFFNGRTAEWSGEAVRVPSEDVGTVLAEKLSPSRTALAVAAGVAGVGGLLASHSLTGGSNGTGEQKTTGTGTSYRGIQ